MQRGDESGNKEKSLTEPNSAPPGRGTPENVKSDAETVGEASGGFLGGVSGMALGVAAGPIGLVLGGIAGAVGGWWAGHGIADAITSKDDESFRAHYQTSSRPLADRTYEDVRAAYVAGHLAGRNPEYVGRSFDDVEADLRQGWTREVIKGTGEWHATRGYARAAFERARKGDSPR